MPKPDVYILTCVANWLWNGVNRGTIRIKLLHTITDFCIVYRPQALHAVASAQPGLPLGLSRAACFRAQEGAAQRMFWAC